MEPLQLELSLSRATIGSTTVWSTVMALTIESPVNVVRVRGLEGRCHKQSIQSLLYRFSRFRVCGMAIFSNLELQMCGTVIGYSVYGGYEREEKVPHRHAIVLTHGCWIVDLGS